METDFHACANEAGNRRPFRSLVIYARFDLCDGNGTLVLLAPVNSLIVVFAGEVPAPLSRV